MSGDRTGLDQPTHRGPVPVKRSERRRFAGVGVGVEMYEAERVGSQCAGESDPVGIGHRVVAAQHDRNGTRCGDSSDGVGYVLEPHLEVAGWDLDVTRIDDPHHLERVDAGREVRAASVRIEIVGLPDRFRPESRSCPVAGSPVDRCADDRDVDAVERVEVYGGNATEGRELGEPPDITHGRSGLSGARL